MSGTRRGCAKTQREIPFSRAKRKFLRFFQLCEMIGLEIWGRAKPLKVFAQPVPEADARDA
jgi:hypothetical protein